MDWKRQIQLAEQIATEAHKGQYRKDGVTEYITHPASVANLVQGRFEYTELEYLRAVAWLHDVLEDTNLTIKDLAEQGIARKVIDSVVILSRFKNETYFDYIRRIAENDELKIVKIADITHNLSTMTVDMGDLYKRYFKALLILGRLI